jgi:hypothetical protein
MEPFLVAGAAGLALSLWAERWRRPAPAAIALHAGLFLLAFLLLAALCRRPFLAAGLALAAHVLVLVVDDAKRRALREPMLFSDYGLFSQALRHPRLYLPYLRPWPVLFAVCALTAVLVASMLLEAPGIPWQSWALLLCAALGLIWAGGRRARTGLALDPERDVARFGLLGSGLLYWIAERAPLAPLAPPALAIRAAPERRPDIVVIECESFFDARRLHARVQADVLRNFDDLCAQGESGRLTVPAWGANTMRTEFAFLSGIAPENLGVHRFNPYRRFARRPVPTVASLLRGAGYRTVCLHPYPASFFGRDRVFPQLGFDEFIDLALFGYTPRDGPYVADAAVARKVAEQLRNDAQPLFVFAITMENHGPQHLEAGPGGDALAVYLRHLRNSDAMLGAVAGTLHSRERASVLCLFGDHVPSLPSVYDAAGFDDPRTDYLVWAPPGRPLGREDLHVEALGERVLRTAGLLD